MTASPRLLIASYLVARGQVPDRAYEVRSLVKAGSERFGDCRAVGFDELAILTGPDARFIIAAGAEPLDRVDALIVRSTGDQFAIAAALADAVSANGGVVLDGATRFGAAANNKVTTTVARHRRGVGGPSMLICGTTQPEELAALAIRGLGDDLVFKPVDGRGGAGVRRIQGPTALVELISDELSQGNAPLLLQMRLDIVAEFRVMKLYNQVLGVAKRVAEEGKVPANVAQGGALARPTSADAEVLSTYAAEHLANDGLIGADVARTRDGQLVLLEENYAPAWAAFESTLAINMAQLVIDSLLTRLGLASK